MHRHELSESEAEWVRVAPLLPLRETSGTYYRGHRAILNRMVYRHATGCPCRDLPGRSGA
jgi:transposase